MRQIRDVAHHKLRRLLAASDTNIERRATGVDGDPRKNTALRPRVACSRDTGRLHKSAS